jgi:DHA2 family multidrug resistance protein
VVDFRPLAERNLAACCIIVFCAYGVLYGASTSLPGLLQGLFGYDAFVSGLVMSPSGFFSILMMITVGILMRKGVDARWLIAAGLIVMATANYWMALLNIYVSPIQVVWPRVLLICGLSMLFAPLNASAYRYTPPRLRGAAVGLMSLLRNEGGSVGTSLAQTVVQRRSQFHSARVNEFLDPLNPNLQAFSEQGQATFMTQTGDVAASQEMTLEVLSTLREQQAASLAYFDVFWLFAVLAVGLIFLVPLMKRSVVEKGEHIGGE